MRNSNWLSVFLLLVLFSCKKTNNNTLITDGTYAGTSQRLIADTGKIANVSLNFSAGKWTGQSDILKYPALCNGNYVINGSENMRFENACPWTADFDGTLILDGQFHLEITDSTLVIERDYTGNVKDIYELKKP
jgi:hypothetical protein